MNDSEINSSTDIGVGIFKGWFIYCITNNNDLEKTTVCGLYKHSLLFGTKFSEWGKR